MDMPTPGSQKEGANQRRRIPEAGRRACRNMEEPVCTELLLSTDTDIGREVGAREDACGERPDGYRVLARLLVLLRSSVSPQATATEACAFESLCSAAGEATRMSSLHTATETQHGQKV